MKKLKSTMDLILAVIAIAMGIAVIVIGIFDPDFTVYTAVRMLGIAILALGMLALNGITQKS